MPDFSIQRMKRAAPVAKVHVPAVTDARREVAAMDRAELNRMTRQRIQSAVAAEWWAKHNLMIGQQLPAK